MLKNIEDFNPLLYESYFVLNTVDNIEIFYFTSNGYISFSDFDVYRMSDISLIAFLDNPDNYWITNYKVNYGENSHIVQGQYYEKILDILNDEDTSAESIHAFSNSVEVYSNNNLGNSVYEVDQRCDYNKYGPTAFYPPSPNRKLGKLLQFRNILSVTGTAHILRLDFESIADAYDSNSKNQSMNQTARTLGALMKQIYEWKQVCEEPWNNQEPIANKAKLFLEELKIDNQALEELLDGQNDMRVIKYLQGETDLFRPIPETGFLSNSFKKYLIDNYRYKSVKNLKINHSLGNLIDSALIDIEKSILEETISFYCMVNGIDRSAMTLEDISDHAYKTPNYIDNNNSITDIIRQLTI